ncbi:MAG: hypothetical protein ACAI34_13975 [Verrucomicrobium sp.]
MADELDEKSRSEEGSSGSSRGGIWAVVVLGLLLAYPLSLGPVAYLEARGALPSRPPAWFLYLYSPLILLMEKSEPSKKVLMTYLDWWVELGKKSKKP